MTAMENFMTASQAGLSRFGTDVAKSFRQCVVSRVSIGGCRRRAPVE